jgi:GrpB-like predicted nucleotidyltransferase (UPF0157 family)
MPDESVNVGEYDPDWPARFAEQQLCVEAILAPWLAAPVEHVGSTAVRGLAAKPVIDMLAPVRSLAQAHDAIVPLQDAGWLFWPDDPGRRYRL